MKTAKIYQPRPRQPVRDVSAKHVKHRRLKPVYDFLNDFCATNHEEKTEMLFFRTKMIPDLRILKNLGFYWSVLGTEG